MLSESPITNIYLKADIIDLWGVKVLDSFIRNIFQIKKFALGSLKKMLYNRLETARIYEDCQLKLLHERTVDIVKLCFSGRHE